MEQVQRRYITEGFDVTHGNVDATARWLGIDRSYLYKLMKRLQMAAPTRTLDRTKGHIEWKPLAARSRPSR